eukprot:3027630-Pleurochrysis_carterae.AAC.4
MLVPLWAFAARVLLLSTSGGLLLRRARHAAGWDQGILDSIHAARLNAEAAWSEDDAHANANPAYNDGSVSCSAELASASSVSHILRDDGPLEIHQNEKVFGLFQTSRDLDGIWPNVAVSDAQQALIHLIFNVTEQTTQTNRAIINATHDQFDKLERWVRGTPGKCLKFLPIILSLDSHSLHIRLQISTLVLDNQFATTTYYDVVLGMLRNPANVSHQQTTAIALACLHKSVAAIRAYFLIADKRFSEWLGRAATRLGVSEAAICNLVYFIAVVAVFACRCLCMRRRAQKPGNWQLCTDADRGVLTPTLELRWQAALPAHEGARSQGSAIETSHAGRGCIRCAQPTESITLHQANGWTNAAQSAESYMASLMQIEAWQSCALVITPPAK